MVHLPPDAISALFTHLTILKLHVAQHLNLNIRELLVIGVLGIHGALSFTDLHRRISIPKSTLSGLVDYLSTRGLVERYQDQQSRRRWLVSLTPSGRRLVGKMRREEAELVRLSFSSLSRRQQAEFQKALHTLDAELR